MYLRTLPALYTFCDILYLNRRMNILIAGCGRVGAQLAMLMSSEDHLITIIDSDAHSFSNLDTGFTGTALVGDCTSENSLREAGLEKADAFIAVTDEDNSNVMSAQLAQYIFNTKKVVCHIRDPQRAEFFQTIGLETVSPTLLFAQLLKEKVTG